MTPLLLIRHGATAWNASGRLQGRADIGLSAAGRAEVGSWRLPAAFAEARWLTSPLRRARETAALLTDRPVALEPRLIEMDWGAWEGLRGDRSARRGPSSPPTRRWGWISARRAARARARSRTRVRAPGRRACRRSERRSSPVCHKGVIRAALALATGWDMRTRPPLRLARDQALALRAHADGRLELGPAPLRLAA